MRFEIGFSLRDGGHDTIIIEGDSIEEIQRMANEEVAKRGGFNPWSRELAPGQSQ